MKSITEQAFPRALVGLFLLALLVLGFGIWMPTGLTGKDEFFLGLRTPMEMMARDAWLVPYLDGVPRIRKPPMLYWLGRISYETFGVSLASARMITVLFACGLVLSTAAIGRTLTRSPRAGLLAGALLVSMLGMATESRRFMLDVPVASCSAMALWALLAWQASGRWWQLSLSTLLLVVGFLIKGPVVFILFGSGALALLAGGESGKGLKQWPWRQIVPHGVLFLALAAPWFLIVKHLHPEALAIALAGEVDNRQFLHVSPEVLLGPLQLALPWSLPFIAVAWLQRREGGLSRRLLVWLGLSLAPFLLAKTFDRYLVGSLVPMAIFLGFFLSEGGRIPPWASRLGAGLAALLGLALAGVAYWFGLGGWYFLVLPMAYLLWAWWRDGALAHRLGSACVYWVALMAGVFPALQVNGVPPAVLDLAESNEVIFYDGPQPAMLAILSGKAHRHVNGVDKEEARDLASRRALVFAEADDVVRLAEDLRPLGYQLVPVGSYQTLASHGSGLRFARTGATMADWQTAFRQRDLTPLKTEIRWSYLEPLPAAGVSK